MSVLIYKGHVMKFSQNLFNENSISQCLSCIARRSLIQSQCPMQGGSSHYQLPSPSDKGIVQILEPSVALFSYKIQIICLQIFL